MPRNSLTHGCKVLVTGLVLRRYNSRCAGVNYPSSVQGVCVTNSEEGIEHTCPASVSLGISYREPQGSDCRGTGLLTLTMAKPLSGPRPPASLSFHLFSICHPGLTPEHANLVMSLLKCHSALPCMLYLTWQPFHTPYPFLFHVELIYLAFCHLPL